MVKIQAEKEKQTSIINFKINSQELGLILYSLRPYAFKDETVNLQGQAMDLQLRVAKLLMENEVKNG